MEEGESLEEALSRELKEEIGLDSYKILGKIKIPFAIGGILMNQTEVHLI
ncbi:MAG: NUDIX domain-containing protein [Bdellovibrionaceae bacterium]|nr:NUDIX domain-containing protein [Pseudobdellovibrionaceae bacterium]